MQPCRSVKGWEASERNCAALFPMDLAGCCSHTLGMLTARRGGAGPDGQGSMQQGPQRGPTWRESAKRLRGLANGSVAGGAVRQEMAGLAIEPGGNGSLSDAVLNRIIKPVPSMHWDGFRGYT